jgi:hypothetical protein
VRNQAPSSDRMRRSTLRELALMAWRNGGRRRFGTGTIVGAARLALVTEAP